MYRNKLHMNIYRNFINNAPNPEMTHISTNRRTDYNELSTQQNKYNEKEKLPLKHERILKILFSEK